MINLLLRIIMQAFVGAQTFRIVPHRQQNISEVVIEGPQQRIVQIKDSQWMGFGLHAWLTLAHGSVEILQQIRGAWP